MCHDDACTAMQFTRFFGVLQVKGAVADRFTSEEELERRQQEAEEEAAAAEEARKKAEWDAHHWGPFGLFRK